MAGIDDERDVRLLEAGERRGHADENDVDLRDGGEVVGGVHESFYHDGADGLVGNVGDVAGAVGDVAAFALVGIDARDEELGFRELDGERQSHVAKAHDADVNFLVIYSCKSALHCGLPLVVIHGPGDGFFKAGFEIDFGAESEQFLCFRDVWYLLACVLVTITAFVLVRHGPEFRLRVRQLDYELCEIDDFGLDVVADVECVAERFLLLASEDCAADGVVDVGEAAGLMAVAVDGEGHVAQRLADEASHHAAVAALVDARAEGVEVTHHRDRQPLRRVRERQVFVHCLRRRVRPAVNERWPKHALRVLAERQFVAAPVYFGRRCENHALPVFESVCKYNFRAFHIDENALQRVVHDMLHPDHSREVIYYRGCLNQFVHQRLVQYRVVN